MQRNRPDQSETQFEAFSILDDLLRRSLAARSQQSASPSEVDEFETKFAVSLPQDYRDFVVQYGTCRTDITIFGFETKHHLLPSAEFAIKTARAVWPDFPTDLVPIEALGGGIFCCLRCSRDEANGRIVRWPPAAVDQGEAIASSFSEHLIRRLGEAAHRDASHEVFRAHVGRFHKDHLALGKLPRNDDWRPYRFCVQDVVIGLVVMKHSLEDNCLVVDVCLTYDPPQFEPNSGSKMTAICLLSEAYKCGGSMEIRFSENVEGGKVPRAICDLAIRAGLNPRYVDSGRLSPSEARDLYLAISDFPPTLHRTIVSLAEQGRLSKERACYAVHHGVWTRAELESIVGGSSDADAILAGQAAAEERHSFLHRVNHARAAVLGGWLDRKLAKRERCAESGDVIDLEDDTRPLNVGFNAELFAKTYLCQTESVAVPWLTNPTEATELLTPGVSLTVLVRPRDASDLLLHFEDDLALAGSFGRGDGSGGLIGVLVPRDFDDLPEDSHRTFVAAASQEGVAILVCPESAFSLDTDVRRRLQSSRLLRQ